MIEEFTYQDMLPSLNKSLNHITREYSSLNIYFNKAISASEAFEVSQWYLHDPWTTCNQVLDTVGGQAPRGKDDFCKDGSIVSSIDETKQPSLGLTLMSGAKTSDFSSSTEDLDEIDLPDEDSSFWTK